MKKKHSKITENDIHALVDNELSQKEAEKVRAYINERVEARSLYQKLCRQKELLREWWKTSGSYH